jgi:PTS system ascorbate-specific IIA component
MQIDDYLFSRNTIALQQDAADWKQAVRIGTDLLRNAGAVDERYYEGILANVEKNGPYFVIIPSVAMPHARPEDGVLETGFSLVTLKRPVSFGHADHDPVDILLVIAAADKKALNESVIVEVMTLLDYEETVERLREATTADDVRALFNDLPKED